MASISSSDSLFNVPQDPDATRRCLRCGKEKLVTTFPPGHPLKDGGRYTRNVCRACINAAKSSSYDYRTARDNHLRVTYNGFSIEDFEAMEARQGGVCASCGNPPSQYTGGRTKRTKGLKPQLHVDHDHKTGRVRALLCHECNSSVGHMHESLERVRQLYRYIQTHCLPYKEEEE